MSDTLKKFDELVNASLPKGFEMDSDVIELSDFSCIVSSKLFYTADKTSDFNVPEKVIVFTFNPNAFLPFFRFNVYQSGIKKHILDHLKNTVLDSYRKAKEYTNPEYDHSDNKIADEINHKLKNVTL